MNSEKDLKFTAESFGATEGVVRDGVRVRTQATEQDVQQMEMLRKLGETPDSQISHSDPSKSKSGAEVERLRAAPLPPAMDLLARAANRLSDDNAPDENWWRDYALLTGEHMILTDEGWQPGYCKAELVADFGADAILDEVNAPEAAPSLPAPLGQDGKGEK